MNLIKELKGGSLSKTEVYDDGGKLFVRKSISIFENREFGLTRWQSQVRKLQTFSTYLPDNSLPIIKMGSNEEYYFFDMAYKNDSKNLYDALKDGVCPKKMSRAAANLINLMAKQKYNAIEGSLEVFIKEEIKGPVLNALNANSLKTLNLEGNEASIFNDQLIRSLPIIDKLAQRFGSTKVYECLTHGNFTLENVLWDYADNKILLIDPYGETYCDTVLSDIAQLLQSSVSGYEFVTRLVEEEPFVIYKYPIHRLPKFLHEFSTALIDKVSGQPWYLPEIVTLLRAAQFIRMFPFKLANSPRQGAMFMCHGLKVLESLDC